MAVPSVSGGFTVLHSAAFTAADGYISSINGSSFLGGTFTKQLFAPDYSISSNGTINGPYGRYTNITSTDFTVANRYLVFRAIRYGENIEALTNTTGSIYGAMSGGASYYEHFYAAFGGGTGSDTGVAFAEPVLMDLNYNTDVAKHDASFDPSVVDKICVGLTDATGNAQYADAGGNFGYLDIYVLIGGTVGTPAALSDILDVIDADSNMSKIVDPNKSDIHLHISTTANMHYVRFPSKIGDGTTETNYTAEVKTIEYITGAADSSINTLRHSVAVGEIGHWIDPNATSTYIFSSHVWTGERAFRWWSKGSGSASVTYTSCNIIGAHAPYLEDGHVVSGCTFADCGMITALNSHISGSVIKDSTATVAIDVVDTANFTDNTVSGNTTGMRFDFAGSASYDLDNIIFSGNTTDIEYTGAGVLTLTQLNGTSVGTTLASGSGSIVLAGAVVEQGLSFTGLVAGSQVVIYETGTTTEIDRDNSTGTSFEWKETFTANQTVDYTIGKAGYVYQRVAGVALTNVVVGVTVQQVVDRPYAASSGLTYSTTVVIDTGAKTVAVSAATTVQNLSAALNEFWIAESALRNINFMVVNNGPNSFTFDQDWELTSGSFAFLSQDGVRYLDASAVRTAAWSAIQTVGSVSGLQAEYQQVIGAAPTDSAATGIIDELIQVYGDSTHGNFDYSGYFTAKFQTNGYEEAVTDVFAQYGTLEDQLYVVALEPTAYSGFTTGDPSITGVTITNHGASPVTWNSKDFSITITDTNSNTGEDIHRWLNYNKSLDATFESEEPYNLFDMVVPTSDSYETQLGTIINSAGALSKGVRVVDGSGDPHPFFSRFQADDATYFTPPQNIILAAASLTAGRIQLYNPTGAAASAWQATTAYTAGNYVLRSTGQGTELGDGVFMICTTAGTTGGSEPTWDVAADGNTTADGSVIWTTRPVEVDNADITSGYNTSWINGEHFTTGDTVRLRWAAADKMPILMTGAAPASGTISFVDVPVADSTYVDYSIDGSTVTEFAADYPNVEVDINDPDDVWYVNRLYAWYKYNLTLNDGITSFWGMLTAVDNANIRINNSVVDMKMDNLAVNTAIQGDTIRLFRVDGVLPVINPTTGGGGLSFFGTGYIFLQNVGSGPLTPSQEAELTSAAAKPTSAQNADAVWDELQSGHTTAGTFGKYVDSEISGAGGGTPLTSQETRDAMKLAPTAGSPAAGSVDEHLDDIPTTPMRGTDSANTVAPDNASVAAIKTKTDSLTFTKANEVDSNIQSVNDVTVTGDGGTGTEWGP